MVIIGIPAIFLVLFICLVLSGILRGGNALESLSIGIINHFEIIIIVYLIINMFLALGQWGEIMDDFINKKGEKPKPFKQIIIYIILTISFCFYNFAVIAFLLLFFVPFFDNINGLFDSIIAVIWCLIGGAIYFLAWGVGVKLCIDICDNNTTTSKHFFTSLLALLLSGGATFILHLGKIDSVLDAIKLYIN